MWRKSVIALAAGLAAVACGPTGGTGTPTTCQVSAAEASAAAGSLTRLRGTPAAAVEILGWHEAAATEIAIATMPDGEFAIVTPFPDPDDLFASGPVTIAIEVDGKACGSLTLQATGLPGPDQPGVAGGFRRMVEDAVQAVDDALREAGLTREELLDDATSSDPSLGLLFAIDFLVRGDDNPNALTRILEDERVVTDDESVAVSLDVLDAVVAMMAANTAAIAPAGSGLAVRRGAVPPQNLQSWAGSPSGLSRMLEIQHDAEYVREPAANITLALGAASALALSLTGGGGVVGYVVFVGTVAMWLTVKHDVHELPNDVQLAFEIAADQINEDGAGTITTIHLTPKNRGGFDAAEMAIDVILSGASIKFERAPARLKELLRGLVITVLGRVSDKVSLLPTPPYEWPPTEVPLSDIDTWIVLRGTALEFVPGSPGSFEPTTAGELTLTLALRAERFGNRDVSHDVPVTVEPIVVKVFPDYVELEPGGQMCFVASVQQADDPGYVWLTDEGELDDEFYCWTAPDSAELEQLCDDATSIQHVITARSTSHDGARQPKHAPSARTGSATAVVDCTVPDDTCTSAWCLMRRPGATPALNRWLTFDTRVQGPQNTEEDVVGSWPAADEPWTLQPSVSIAPTSAEREGISLSFGAFTWAASGLGLHASASGSSSSSLDGGTRQNQRLLGQLILRSTAQRSVSLDAPAVLSVAVAGGRPWGDGAWVTYPEGQAGPTTVAAGFGGSSAIVRVFTADAGIPITQLEASTSSDSQLATTMLAEGRYRIEVVVSFTAIAEWACFDAGDTGAPCLPTTHDGPFTVEATVALAPTAVAQAPSAVGPDVRPASGAR